MPQAISQATRASVVAEASNRVDALPLVDRIIAGVPQPTISARDLHAYLGVRRDFSNWIKDRIDEYGFDADTDFIRSTALTSPNLASAKSRPQKVIEYHATLDMAKELAMVERNERGRAARRYFIECERKLAQRRPTLVDPAEMFTDPANLRSLLLEAVTRLAVAEAMEPAAIEPLLLIEEAAAEAGVLPDRAWHAMVASGWVLRAAVRLGQLPRQQLATEAGISSGAVRPIVTERGVRVAVTRVGLERLKQVMHPVLKPIV